MMELITGLITMMITEYVHVICFKYCINEKLNVTFWKVLLLILLSSINFFNNLYNIVSFKILIILILLVILLYFWFKKDLKKTIIIGLIISITSMAIEFLLSFITALFVKNINELNNILYLKYGFTIVLAILVYLIFTNKYIILAIRKLIKFLEKKINIEFIVIICIVTLNLILIKFNVDYRNSMNNFLNIIVFILLSILIVNLLKTNYKKEIYEIKSKDMQKTINRYEEMLDDYKELKHNLNNDLLTIKSLCSKRAQNLIDEKLKKYNKNYEWVNNFDKMPKGLQGLIY